MTLNPDLVRLPDWGFHLSYWVADGDPAPEVPFPRDWEVCGVPDFDPLAMRHQDRRRGLITLAWPMYHPSNPMVELDAVCRFLEQMTAEAMAIWLSMQDRYLSVSCGDIEMDAAELSTRGFFIAPELMQRLRRLKIRLRVSFHPHAGTRMNIDY